MCTSFTHARRRTHEPAGAKARAAPVRSGGRRGVLPLLQPAALARRQEPGRAGHARQAELRARAPAPVSRGRARSPAGTECAYGNAAAPGLSCVRAQLLPATAHALATRSCPAQAPPAKRAWRVRQARPPAWARRCRRQVRDSQPCPPRRPAQRAACAGMGGTQNMQE